MKKLTTEEFIQKARVKYGNKYDYSQVEYKGNKIKISIICPKHGLFEQTPDKHLGSKYGCTQCGEEMSHIHHRNSLSEMIDRFRAKHGNKYDYSKVDYTNTNIKVCIICPEHGEFWQTPSNHLSGKGCEECGKKKIIKSLRTPFEEFIKQANIVHNNKYNYIESSYIDTQHKVDIICPIHGLFHQTPRAHVHQKQGCPYCGRKKANISESKTTEQFVEEARKVHGDMYDYSEVEYVNACTKVKIICPEHGVFEQLPDNHLHKKGCWKCSLITNGTSESERNLLQLLKEKFGENNVENQYKESRYPFHCDFYIKSLDLFIELNASQYHNGHFFDENNKDDLKQLKIFQERASKSEHNQYHEIIKTWTVRDLLKKKTAEDNNLNYKVFWDNDLSDAKEWLDSI